MGQRPGGYRATANDNIVLILMIETVGGVKEAYDIAKVPGVTAVFAASGDLGNFSGYAQGSPDYERLINVVHDAVIILNNFRALAVGSGYFNPPGAAFLTAMARRQTIHWRPAPQPDTPQFVALQADWPWPGGRPRRDAPASPSGTGTPIILKTSWLRASV